MQRHVHAIRSTNAGALGFVFLLTILLTLPGRSVAAGLPGLSLAPSCKDFEALMLASKVPSVRLNTGVWSGSNSVRPRELISVNTGNALDLPASPAVYVLTVPAKLGGIREALLQGGYIVNGAPDPYNAIPVGTIVPFIQKGATDPVNVEVFYCGWVVTTIALADRLRQRGLSEALWQFGAIISGPQPGADEPSAAQEFRASLSKRLLDQSQRLASVRPSGVTASSGSVVTDELSSGRLPGLTSTPSIFMAGATKLLGQFALEAGGTNYSGQGSVSWPNGDVFNGTLISGSREGNGKFVWANGQRYEGEWRRDRPNGQGGMWFANGDQYEGAIKDGVANGPGRIKYQSGDRYEGQFLNGVAHGRGAYTWVSGQRLEGDWIEGQGKGSGNMRFSNGDMYDGTVANGSPNGRGRMIYASGDMYVGTVKNGLPDGEGTFIWKRGDQYRGQWKSGLKDGSGVLTWDNGDRWQGTYRNDEQGEGVIVRSAK